MVAVVGRPEDMEKLKFYSYTDGDGEKIFFVPVNGSMANGLCHDGKNIMFRFIKQEIHPRRRIEEPPEAVSYCVYPTDVTDIMDMFCGMGTVEREFPTDKSRGEDSLKENEYVRAAVEMIHGTLKGEGVYGRYDIYIGEYYMTDDVCFYDELGDRAVNITAAAVCLDNGYGYYCHFLASDVLVDGEIRIFYALPPTANAWKDMIGVMMEGDRLVIPLEVTPEDMVMVQENPYSFIMVPVLDYAVGDGIFPEDAMRSGDMVFY